MQKLLLQILYGFCYSSLRKWTDEVVDAFSRPYSLYVQNVLGCPKRTEDAQKRMTGDWESKG